MKLQLKTNSYFKDLYDSNDYYLIFYGGAGAGKSYAIAQKLILRILTEKNHRILCVRKFASTLESSVIQLLRDVIHELGLDDKFDDKGSRPRSITCKETKSQLLFLGIDDPEKLKSLSGVTGAWIEEATELNKEDFLQLDLRIRGKTNYYKQLILSFNPTNVGNWTYETFFSVYQESFQGKYKIMLKTYLDNRFIDEEYKNKLEALKDIDIDYYNVYALGHFGALGDIVYKPFKTEPFDFTDNNIIEKWYGLDVGFRAPCALIECVLYDDTIYIKELLYKSNLTDIDLRQELIKLNVNNYVNMYVDSAAASTIESLKRIIDNTAGYRVFKANKEVEAGINSVRSLHHKIIIHPDSKNLLNESKSYSWKKLQNGNFIDKVDKINDHLMDAMRYAIHSHKMIHRLITKIK